MAKTPITISAAEARRIWLHAQRLDVRDPFGSGPAATAAAVAHLGYVQIDTINVVERAHHHILFSRIPSYKRSDLGAAQSTDKSVFEYWTHALAYVPTRDLPFFLSEMKQQRAAPMRWYADANPDDLKLLLKRIRKDGAISIRDIDTDDLVEKDHPWASRKPSKRVLQYGFYSGELVISQRSGMVKTYELIDRHFGWPPRPKPATERQIASYRLDRALRSHGLINASSVLHMKQTMPAEIAALVESRVRKKELVSVAVEDHAGSYWAAPEALSPPESEGEFVHILSPFDPLVIQRKRTAEFFGYEHVFEAYVAKEKRRFGYFTLPVLRGDRVVAALDLKTDRAAGKLLVQAWHWISDSKTRDNKAAIEDELQRFERFQLAAD